MVNRRALLTGVPSSHQLTAGDVVYAVVTETGPVSMTVYLTEDVLDAQREAVRVSLDADRYATVADTSCERGG